MPSLGCKCARPAGEIGKKEDASAELPHFAGALMGASCLHVVVFISKADEHG